MTASPPAPSPYSSRDVYDSVPRVILVEGPQGSGKTTLVQGLQRALPLVVTLKKQPMPFAEERSDFLALAAAFQDQVLISQAFRLQESTPGLIVVIDRGLLSNVVYTMLRSRRIDVENFVATSGLIQILSEFVHRGGCLAVLWPRVATSIDRIKPAEWTDWQGTDRWLYSRVVGVLRAVPQINLGLRVIDPGFEVEDPKTVLADEFLDRYRAG